MKIIVCSKCGQKLRIPDDKHIHFKCANSLCRKEYEYINGKKVSPSIFKYWIPSFAILIAIIGCFFPYLFPIPVISGSTWFIWWLFKSSKKMGFKLLSSLSLSTAIGMSLLLIIQITLNFISNPVSIEIPNWLIHLDDFLIWSRQNLTYISEISFCLYLIIIIGLLFLTYKQPTYKPVSKFVNLEGWIGKITSVLIVLISFTFFTPSVLENTVDNSYYKHYKVVYRKKLEQDRKQLIAYALRKRIEYNDTTDYDGNFSALNQDLKKIATTDKNVSNEAKKDVDSVMSWENIPKAENTKYYPDDDWNGSDESLKKSWKNKSSEWRKYKGNTNTKKEKKTKNYNSQNNPRNFVEAKISEVKIAEILADEAIEALKAVFLKLCGEITPEMETFFRKYIEEVINTAAEYIFDGSKIDRIVQQFFNNNHNMGNVDVFARIENWWQNNINKQRQIAQEREQLIEKENESLTTKLENKIKKLEVDIPDKWQEIKASLENKKGMSMTDGEVKNKIKEKVQDDIRLLLMNNIPLNARERNVALKKNLDIVSNAINVSEVLKVFERANYLFRICSKCHMPIIPGSSCIM